MNDQQRSIETAQPGTYLCNRLAGGLAILYGLPLMMSASWGVTGEQPIQVDLYLVLLSVAFGAYFVMISLIHQQRVSGGTLRGWMLLAVLIRALTLAGPHRHNSDLWRYAWDGHVLVNGFHPYKHVPDSLVLDPVRDPLIYSSMNPQHNHVPTVYGPVATLAFAVCTLLPGDPVANLRFLMVLGDVLTMVLLVRLLRRLELPEEWALIYSLNPLLIDSFAQRGQMEGLLLPCLVLIALMLAHRRTVFAGAMLAVAAHVKIVALALLPVVLIASRHQKRRGAMESGFGFAVVFVPGLIPFVTAGSSTIQGFLIFAAKWRTNASLFPLVENHLGKSLATGTSAVILTLVTLRVTCVSKTLSELLGGFAIVFLTLLLLGPAVFPWYLTWGLPFTLFLFTSKHHHWLAWAYLCWSATVCLWYLRFFAYPPIAELRWPNLTSQLQCTTTMMSEPWRILEYTPVLIFLVLSSRLRWQSRYREMSHVASCAPCRR